MVSNFQLNTIDENLKHFFIKKASVYDVSFAEYWQLQNKINKDELYSHADSYRQDYRNQDYLRQNIINPVETQPELSQPKEIKRDYYIPLILQDAILFSLRAAACSRHPDGYRA